MKMIYRISGLLIICFLFTAIKISAQSVCSGPITLSTQTQVDNLKCSAINGNLTIQDNNDGIDNIVSLKAIFENGLQNGSIDGDLRILNCNSLESMTGLQGITDISGELRISNCGNLQSLGSVNYNLVKIGSNLLFLNLPDLTDISSLVNLESVGRAIGLQGQCGLSDLEPLNNVSYCPWVEFYQTDNDYAFAPFEGLKETGLFRLFQTSLVEFEGMYGLQQAVPYSSPSLPGQIQIDGNSKLKALSLSNNINSAEVLNIRDNTSLSDCCMFIDVLNSNPPTVNISNNATGCDNAGQIDAPPSLSCPSNVTINTDPGTCVGNTSINAPIVVENCDPDQYFLDATLGDGSTVDNLSLISGALVSYTVPTTLNEITFTAIDENGNIGTCNFTIVVEDNQSPTISNIPADVTINCDDDFPSIPSPLVTDNCDDSPNLTASSSLSIGGCGLGEAVEIHEYSWTATDDEGNSTSAEWRVTVISDLSFDLGGTVEVCEGESIVLDPGNVGNTYNWSTGANSQTINVTNPGTYSLTVTSNYGCCYVDEVNVVFASPPNASATGAVLDCNAASVQIMGSSTTAGVSYSWTGPGGYTSNAQNPSVSSVGEYFLTVSTADGCTATATAEVTADNDVPNVVAEGGIISCNDPSAQLMGSSTTAGVSFSWSGPGSFTSNEENPTVSTPGTYTLTVESGNGCSASADVEVVDDTAEPNIDLSGGTLDCNLTSLPYELDGDVNWSGPNGFSSTSNMIEVSEPGIYNVTVTGENGCSATENFVISEDLTEPNISASGGTLNCTTAGITLQGSSTTAGASYSWTGPNDFAASIANPFAVSVGTYTLVVTGENGCTASAQVEVMAGEDAPIVEASGGTIDCIITTVDLMASASQENLTYMWTGPGGFSQEGSMIQVSEAGIYTVTATNEDGCSGSAVVEVIDNSIAPEVSISAPNINCQEGSSQFSVETSTDISIYSWTGPNGFVSDIARPSVLEPGLYTLVVTAENGCTGEASFDLASDVDAPQATATGGVLTCTENSIVIQGSSETANVTFLWEGPDGFVSEEQNPTVSVAGDYVFNVIAENGCVTTDTAEVVGDANLPTISATGGTIDCINEEVMLIGSTTSEGVTFEWNGPNGFSTTQANPTVDNPGFYTFTVANEGCEVFATVEVKLDIQIPDVLLSQGIIDCDDGTRIFNVSTNALNGAYSWEGPDGFTSDRLAPEYSKAGLYTITITDDNGCSSVAQIEVAHDVNFDVDLMISGNDATVEIIGGTPPFTVVFNNSIEGNTATDLGDGDHFVSIMDGLECERIIDFTIMSTSTDDIENDDIIQVYPNPVEEEIFISWQLDGKSFTRFRLMDTDGKVHRDRSIIGLNQFSENLNQLPSGIYLIQLVNKEKLVTKKFMKI